MNDSENKIRNDIHTESMRLFNEISTLKEQIYYHLNEANNVHKTLPICSQWNHDLKNSVKSERDLHAHLIGKDYRIMQWNAHIYSLHKEYYECSFDLMKKFYLQYECIEELIKVCRPGIMSLTWDKVNRIVEQIASLNNWLIRYCFHKHKSKYRYIEKDDLLQTLWVVMMISIRKYDPGMSDSFMFYYDMRANLELMRQAEKEKQVSFRAPVLIQFSRFEKMLSKEQKPYSDAFKKECEFIFDKKFEDLIQDHEYNRNVLNKSKSISWDNDNNYDNNSLIVVVDPVNVEEEVNKKIQLDQLKLALEQLDERTRRLLLDEKHTDDIDLSSVKVKNIKKKGRRTLLKIIHDQISNNLNIEKKHE